MNNNRTEKYTEDILKIANKEIPVRIGMVPQSSLQFYPENPRVYSILNIDGSTPSQEEIEEYMCKQDHVKQLETTIKTNGGLIDALIVRSGDMTVLEGNSRLAAYRLLFDENPVQWGLVKCVLLPEDIDESVIFALLGQYHIIGKKDWDPYEQAHYLYRRKINTKMPMETIVKELGITLQKAESMISVIEFMKKHNDMNKKRWSYYDEYLKSRSLKKYRDTSVQLDETIAESIKTGKINRAEDIRKLSDVAKVPGKSTIKIMRQVEAGAISIYQAHEVMEESGKMENVVKKLNRFRSILRDKNFEKQIFANEEIRKEAKYEIDKIFKSVKKLKDALDKYE